MQNKDSKRTIFILLFSIGVFLVGKGMSDLGENNLSSLKMIAIVMQIGGGLVAIGGSIWGFVKSPKKEN